MPGLSTQLKYIILAVEPRRHMVEEQLQQIPEAIVHYDTTSNGATGYMSCFKLAERNPAIIIEDDAMLCKDFKKRTDAVIAVHKNTVVHFFTGQTRLNKPQWRPGSGFSNTQAVYYPKNFAHRIVQWWNTIPDADARYKDAHDWIIRDFLKGTKERHLLWFPSLTQHRRTKSFVNPKRTPTRQSKYFIDDLAQK